MCADAGISVPSRFLVNSSNHSGRSRRRSLKSLEPFAGFRDQFPGAAFRSEAGLCDVRDESCGGYVEDEHLFMSLLGIPSHPLPPIFPSTNLFSDATFRIISTTYWNQNIILCHSAVAWHVWPSGKIRLQTQVMSSSSASMSVTNTRRSTSPTATRISRTSATQQSPPLRIFMHLDILELQAAASMQQQQARFPLC